MWNLPLKMNLHAIKLENNSPLTELQQYFNNSQNISNQPHLTSSFVISDSLKTQPRHTFKI